MSGLKLTKFIKLSTILLLLWGIECIFMTSIARATIDETTHWPVEVTSRWNAVYGEVTGLLLEEGDSVGMFDTEGNCYGAGPVRGGYYFLSAFMWEEADPSNPHDFPIPGFKNGDTVIFKAYKESTGQEYVLVPKEGNSYVYMYNQNRYPPTRIDLAYEEDDSLSSLPDDKGLPPLPEGLSSLPELPPLPEGLPPLPELPSLPNKLPSLPDKKIDKLLADLDEIELGDIDEFKNLSTKPEEIEEEIAHKEKGISRRDNRREPYYKESYPDYYGRRDDYIETEQEPSRYIIDRPSKYAIRGGKAISSKHASLDKEMKENVATEEDAAAETEKSDQTDINTAAKAIKEEPTKKGFLFFLILIILIGTATVYLIKKIGR